MAVFILLLIILNNLALMITILFFLGIFTRGTSPVVRAMVANSLKERGDFDKGFSFHSFSLNSSIATSRTIYGFAANIFGIASVFYLSALVALFTILPITIYSKYKK